MTSRAHWEAHDRRRRILARCRLAYPDKADGLIAWRNHGREFVAGYPVDACCIGYRDGPGLRVLAFAGSWAKLEKIAGRE